MNTYATLDELKAALNISVTTYDSRLTELLKSASRDLDNVCGREFFSESATRYYDGTGGTRLRLDDAQSISALTMDSEGDGTYDGETWTEGTDFILDPPNSWPKTSARIPSWGNYSFDDIPKYVQAVGVWGYGDGTSDPWTATSITTTVATTSGTTLTISAEGTLEVGHTIKVDTEQMWVSAVSTTGDSTATVIRGVNGTTPAAHSTGATYTANYPECVRQAAVWFAAEVYNLQGGAGEQLVGMGDYKVRRVALDDGMRHRLLGPVLRPEAH